MKINLTVKALLALLAMVAMTILFYHMALRVNLNSDIASALLEAKDISQGNVLLKGWSLSTVSFYFTEIIWYSLAISITGYSYKLAHVIPAIYLTLLCVAVIASSRNKKAASVFVLFFLATPTLALAVNILHTVIHVGTYISCLACLYLCRLYAERGMHWALIPLTVLLTMIYVSDSIAAYLFLLPCAFIVFTSFINMSLVQNKKWILIFAINLLSFILAMIVKNYISRHGFVIPGLYETRLATGYEILKNLSDLLSGLLNLYHANFTGLMIKEAAISLAPVSFIVFVIFVAAFILRVSQYKSFKADDFFLLVAASITPVAFVFSNVSQGPGSIRYIIPFFIFGIIFISRLDYSKIINSRLQALIIAAALVTSLAHAHETLSRPRADDRAHKLSEALEKRGIESGFAEFWNASSVSVYGDVQISPVYYNEEKIIPMPWLSKESWYKGRKQFIIISDEKIKSAAVNLYGKPDDIMEVEGYTVYIWNGYIEMK